jgi:MtrB/PioB family decaheme-associated outer membrane protein
VPEPIDYETDNFDASLSFTGKKAQFAFNYNLSVFRDNNDALTFQNPFASSSWAAAASFPDGFGSLALPPDNEAHSFTFVGRYLLTNRTSATANVTYSRMTQDDQFLPYTINPGLTVTIPTPLDSLDGEINTITANLGISSKLTPKLTVNTSYRYENRDNNTPQELFFVLRGDVEDQNTDIAGSRARFNLPYSREQHRFQTEATYSLSNRTRLSAGYEYEQFERDFTERRTTREHKAHAKLSSSFSQSASGWVGVNYSMRDGSEYIGNVPFVASRTPERVGPDPASAFENHPLVRKFYIADRDQIRVNGAFTWMATDDFTVSAAGRYS